MILQRSSGHVCFLHVFLTHCACGCFPLSSCSFSSILRWPEVYWLRDWIPRRRRIGLLPRDYVRRYPYLADVFHCHSGESPPDLTLTALIQRLKSSSADLGDRWRVMFLFFPCVCVCVVWFLFFSFSIPLRRNPVVLPCA